jgi:hypothetical protein
MYTRTHIHTRAQIEFARTQRHAATRLTQDSITRNNRRLYQHPPKPVASAEEHDPTLREKDVLKRALEQQFDQVASKHDAYRDEMRALSMQQQAVSSAAQQQPLRAVGVPFVPSQAVNGVAKSVGMPHAAKSKGQIKGKVIQQGLRLLGSSSAAQAAMHGE